MENADEHPLIKEYRQFSPKSSRLAERARGVFPGGDTRSSAHFGPYPLSIESGSGCHVVDSDGHQLLDFMNNFTSLIHGHAYPAVVEAVQKQAALGSAYAATSLSQIQLAELISSRVSSIEQLRFTSSGTEGTLMSIRCARAATGKQKIMKMEGGYHGSYEQAEVSLVPFPGRSGPLESPVSQPIDNSFPNSVLEDTIVCPFNQPALAESLIEQHAEHLAAIIVEPVLGSMGMLPASPEFLETLRKACNKHGIVLIFDEVITLRLGFGGAQSALEVEPDLTCMGKIIGGGLPVGGVGGKKELMQLFSPNQKQPVMHASTFSGNALTMSAGLASMNALTEKEVNRINQLGEQLRQGFNQAFQQAGIQGQATGAGSLVNLHLTNRKLDDSRQSIHGTIEAGHITQLLHLTMLRHGVMSASRLMYCVSTAMGQAEIDHAITALNETLTVLRPFIEQERPQLLVA